MEGLPEDADVRSGAPEGEPALCARDPSYLPSGPSASPPPPSLPFQVTSVQGRRTSQMERRGNLLETCWEKARKVLLDRGTFGTFVSQ